MPIIRFVFAILGFAAFLVSTIALAAEVLSVVTDGELLAKPLGEIWAKTHIASYQAVQVGIERHLGLTWLWQNLLLPLLELPPIATAGAFGVLGFVLVLVGRNLNGRGD
jgi:hypothetical protein